MGQMWRSIGFKNPPNLNNNLFFFVDLLTAAGEAVSRNSRNITAVPPTAPISASAVAIVAA